MVAALIKTFPRLSIIRGDVNSEVFESSVIIEEGDLEWQNSVFGPYFEVKHHIWIDREIFADAFLQHKVHRLLSLYDVIELGE
ncbi:MAG: hypothetical protein ACKO96_18485 [Flammeovirgaceae bacterium]